LDPRLNYEQALEMALFISRKMSRLKAGCGQDCPPHN
jgi:hypothetical protein